MYCILTSATYLWYKQSQIQKMSYLNRNLLSSENAAPTPRLTPCFKAPLNLPAILTSLVIIMERHESRSPLLALIDCHVATSFLNSLLLFHKTFLRNTSDLPFLR